VKTSTIQSNSVEDTESIAARIGAKLLGGEVIELISDLGGGKTAFVRGLVRGMGSKDTVNSPTFTLGKEYTAGDITVYHYDFYRLQDAGILSDELREVITDNKAVVVIEWAESVSDVLPKERITVTMYRQHSGEDHRDIEITYPESLDYVMQEPAS
jgi:tRNA threonylcarbamoyladenosine biosynthesis protein TsaE